MNTRGGGGSFLDLGIFFILGYILAHRKTECICKMSCVIDLRYDTHSVSRALRDKFPNSRIISYDLDPWCATNLIPNHEFRLSDVRDIDPEALKLEVGRPLFIWASPPCTCTQSSIARLYASAPCDLEGADSIVWACMDII